MTTPSQPNATPSPSPDDRRVFSRHALRIAILVSPTTPADPEGSAPLTTKRTAFTGDVSVSGLRFESRVAYTVGRVVSIHFTIGVKPYKVSACVTRSRPIRVGGRLRYDCAVQFAQGQDISTFIPALAKYLARRPALP